MDESRLGILDWGIGGIGIYKLIKERFPNTSVLYFSDTGATPYGKMSRPELISRLNDVVRYMGNRGASHVIIGCNAASTAIPYLDKNGVHVDGVIETAVEVAVKARPTRLGLIGGRRTVVSGAYRRALADRGIDVEQRVAQPLSGLIESGDTSSETLRMEAARILRPIRDSSHILLACTHYPAIVPVLKEFVSPGTIFLDPAPFLVQELSKLNPNGLGRDEFFTTGDTRSMTSAAKNAFDVRIGRPVKVPLDLR
jgi:glutamate racemase